MTKKTNARPHESTLYPDIINGALLDGWALFRISDQAFGKKPFDIAGCAPDGKAVGVEVKVVDGFPNGYEDFPWEQFEPNQINWLKAYKDTKAYALMPLYNWKTEEMRIYRLIEANEIPFIEMIKGRYQGYLGWSQLLKSQP